MEEELTVTEAKLLHKVVSLEQKISELKSQLNQEKEEKLAAQKKHRELECKGFQLGKELTEIIEQLTSDLLKEERGGQDDGDGDSDMQVLRRNIPRALKSLKLKIQRLEYDKEVLELLKKMVIILVLRRKSEEPAANQLEIGGSDSDDSQSTPIVKTLRIFEHRSELEEPQPSCSENALERLDPSSSPEVLPIQPNVVPIQLDSDSEDDDVVFLEQFEASPSPVATGTVPTTTTAIVKYVPLKEMVTPRIVSTYSVQPEIRGQFTTSGSDNEQSDYEDDNAIPIPSTSKTRPRFVAMKRTGGFGFVPRISKLEDQALVPVRKSARLSKPTFKMQGQIVKEERKPKLEKATQVTNLKKITKKKESTKKDKEHYLVATRKMDGYHCACGKQYISKNGFKAHVGTMTGDLKFKCPICQKRYFWYSVLAKHLMDAHKAVLDPETNLYGCSFCGDSFSSYQQLFQHLITAHSSLINEHGVKVRFWKQGKN